MFNCNNVMFERSKLVILTYLFVSVNERDWRYPCMTELYEHVLGYLIILSGCIITEACIAFISTRGTIMDNEPRASMQYLLYVRLGILVVEIVWLGIGLVWLYHNYEVCDHGRAKEVIFTFTICNSVLIFMVFVIGWCSFDRAGRSFVKMKRYQNSLKESQCKYKYKRSGSTHRNWRHRKAVLGYQDSWNRRCQMLFCCLGNSDRNQSSFAEVAKILSEFFRDLDVVPTDIIAGLIIVRKQQKMQRELMVNSFNNDINQFLSGVPITFKTKFLDVSQPEVTEEINTLIYYLDYAIASYGYLMYVMMSNKATACCKLCPYLKCKSTCCCLNGDLFSCFGGDEASRTRKKSSITSDISEKMFLNQVSGDNCCACNYAALNRLLKNKNYDLVYSSYHVEIGEPPFIVVLDHDKKNLVISVRGTLSLQDIITDLNAEGDLLPVNPPKEDWTAHKGMIEAAVYIQTELAKNKIIERALNFDLEKNTTSYTIVLVGHSLGAGVCSILSILLKQSKFPDLVCYSYAPPGGLLSYELVEYSKSFITSVVLGKDIVPRLGLRQMESLRYDLIHAIKESSDPKYKIIGSVLCCCPAKSSSEVPLDMDSTSIGEISNGFNGSTSNGGLLEDTLPISTSCSTSYTRSEKELSAHPHDSSIALSVHKPLYPGGKMIHIVRTHSDDNGKIVKKRDVTYKAIYVDNTDFNEILITPVMIQDHMPNRIMDGLQKLFANPAQQKVQRCKTISNGSYPNIGRFGRDHHYGSDLARPLLSCSNWSTDTLDRTSTIQIQPVRQVQYEYPEMDLRPSSKNEDLQRIHPINSLRLKKQNAGSINEIIRKMKKIDLSTDDWISAIGKAPLATPETTSLSETSSICSRGTANDPIINRNSNLKTVSEGILKEASAASDSVTIQIENEPPAEDLSKVDVALNIDIDALFDQLEKSNAANLDKLDARRALEDQLNAQSNRSKYVKRTSSLKRTDSTSSSSKRVTFDSTTVINTGETVLINKPQCRRSNSERIRRKVFSPIVSSKNQKLKQIRQEAESQQKQMPIKGRDQEDNELNEKLEELLGHSFSYSDTDLNKLDDENVKLVKSKLEEDEHQNGSNRETIQAYVHSEPLTTSENSSSVRLDYSPVKQVYSPTEDYSSDDYSSIKIATNLGSQIVISNMTLSRSNEPSPKKSPAAAAYQSLDEQEFSNDLYDKEQYEKLFQKLSTIESPIEEELTIDCDTTKKFKSDLNQINE